MAERWQVSANSCVKLSILPLYISIFRTEKYHYLALGLMALTVVYWTAMFPSTFLIHFPKAYVQGKHIGGGQCTKITLVTTGAAITSLVLDIITIALPMPVLW